MQDFATLSGSLKSTQQEREREREKSGTLERITQNVLFLFVSDVLEDLLCTLRVYFVRVPGVSIV